ncbi:alpha/beta hydrolase [Halobacteriovorax sp. HLS]|uniref:alpha/beta hydrolase n=1 Tax=Halobacteriovorax sp. HLS TaxID=2234000 RepID=UPI0013E40681|nr:alpha/beta fold hydrolase [Halobacteriovorax sp. HLS]
MKNIIKILVFLAMAIPAQAIQKTQIYDEIIRTDQTHVGDVLYLHGLGDNLENHPRLFSEWTKRGYNVISFDYPDHGRTFTSKVDDLNFYTLKRLSNIAEKVLNEHRSNRDKKLVIAGWSTGGILAIRAIQDYFSKNLIKEIDSLILYAPGVGVKICPGNKYCTITNETLTDDEQFFNRTISPKEPLLKPAFGMNLILEGRKSFKKIPAHIEALVFSASFDDKYVKTHKIHKWVNYQRDSGHKKIKLTHCPKSKHELDNGLSKSGSLEVRQESGDFLDGKHTLKRICHSL